MMDKVRGWVLGNNPATYPDYYRILATGIDEIVAPNPPISCPTLLVTGDEGSLEVIDSKPLRARYAERLIWLE